MTPTYEEPTGCDLSCCCAECRPDLSRTERYRKGTWERYACGCPVCRQDLMTRP